MIDPAGFNELKLCRTGPMLFNKNDWPIGTSLKKYGEYCWTELWPLEQIVRPGQLAIDVGANIGTHTVRLSQLVGNEGCVLAFEPQRISFQTLCANVALNNCINVRAWQKALGRSNGTIMVPVRDQYKPNNFGGVALGEAKDGELVELMALDSLKMRACHFIKVDIEGMEGDFLAGAERTIREHRPVLYMEGDGKQAKDVIRNMLSMRYKMYWHVAELFNPENFAGDEENVFLSENGSTTVAPNIMCFPEEMRINVRDLSRVESADDNWWEIEEKRRRTFNKNLERAAA